MKLFHTMIFTSPNYYSSTNQLLEAFEVNDLRKSVWIDSSVVDTQVYYYPFKYTLSQGEPGNVQQHYMVLRLAEQYLVRAEARARQNNLAGALSDINAIRERAGLSLLQDNMTEDEIVNAIAHERQIEMFAEWGHRWFDLKKNQLRQYQH